ncbi:MAG: hypothetical protein WCX61_02795 [Candidatus Peribacteraceae bacterium]
MTSSLLLALFLSNFTMHGDLPVSSATEQEVHAPGVLTVDVHGVTAERGVPPGAQRVPMLELTLSASCEADIRVASLTVQRRGLGSREDIDAVYLMSGTDRVSNAQSIANRDGTVQLRTTGLFIEACTSKTFVVAVDFSENAAIAGEHRFIFVGPRGVDAGDATVRVRYGDTVSRVVRRTAGLSIGIISVENLRVFTSPTWGSQRILARLQLESDGRDDHAISAITLTNNGSARDRDLQNLFIQAGQGMASQRIVTMDDDHVRFVFDPSLLLQKHTRRILVVRGDVRASRSRTIDFVVEENSDIEATPVRSRS